MVRKCKNPWCEGTGKIHPAAFALCPKCWAHVGIIFAVVVVLNVLEEWDERAMWAFIAVVLLGGGVWFAVVWRRDGFASAWRSLSGEARTAKVEDADGPQVPKAGGLKRFRHWLRGGAFIVLVLVGVAAAANIAFDATLDVLSLLQ